MADSRGSKRGSGSGRTGGRTAASSARGKAAQTNAARRRALESTESRRKGLPPGFSEGRPLPEAQRSTVRMEPKEKLVGLMAAGLLALVAVLFFTVSPAHGQPQPDHHGPYAALVLCILLVASLALGNRIVSGLLALLASFLVQTPHEPHSIVWMRTAALVIGLGYALWLTLQQRHAQIDNRMRRTADDQMGRSDI